VATISWQQSRRDEDHHVKGGALHHTIWAAELTLVDTATLIGRRSGSGAFS
jgi:hypothetical protein